MRVATADVAATALFLVALMFVNPVYVILAFALLPRRPTDAVLWWAVPLALALFVSNRQIGVAWGFESAFGLDDATEYLKQYEFIKNGGLSDVLTRFEPALFLLYRLYAYGPLSDYAVVLMSTAVPLALLYWGLQRTTELPLLFLTILVGLIPGFWDSTFHLFRTAFAVSLFIPRLVSIARGRSITVVDVLLPALAHVGTLFFSLPLVAFRLLRGSDTKRYGILVLLVVVLPLPLILLLANMFAEAELVRLYLRSTGELALSPMFYVLLAVAGAGVVYFRRTYLGMLCACIAGSFLLAYAGLGGAAERFILLGTLYLSVPVYQFVSTTERRRRATIALAAMYIALGSTKYDGGVDYPKSVKAFIANGHFYSPWAGAGYNILGVLGRLERD